MSREHFIQAVMRKREVGRKVFGTGTSIVCQDLMKKTGVYFPDAHLDAEKMAVLAVSGRTVLGFDVVMPLFSVCHEVAAMGSEVSWGRADMMPESGKALFKEPQEIVIPADLLKRPGCAVPLGAISLLKKRLGDDAAVCGKVFGPWTLAYHLFGVESFLIGTVDDPDKTRRILERLMPVTLAFADAQIEAGADCLLLADHATRDLCSPQSYREFLMAIHGELAGRIAVPVILHICGDTADRIGMIAKTGLACFHWDTSTGACADVRALAGDALSLMGGISNLLLLRGNRQQVADAAREASAGDIDIIGPECAIPLGTPLENLMAITDNKN